MHKSPLKKPLIITAIVIFFSLIVVGVLYFNSQNKSTNDVKDKEVLNKNEITVVTNPVESTKDFDSNNNSESSSTEKPVPAPVTKTVTTESGYITYDESKLANAEYGRVVLFFHAAWCPSCRSLESDIRKNQNQIPNDLLIMKIDYDTNPELKKKYQIVQQHTLVKVDEEGNSLQTNKGLYQLNTLESVIKNF